ncbi:MAG: hypothetical protein V2A73_01035 [Pseudomonadota bacterium]
MMSRSRLIRLAILCEDHRTERFACRLCNRYGVGVASVTVAPEGKGSASDWVKHHYPDMVRKRRSKNYQKNLGLLVLIDGDEHRCHARHRELANELAGANIEPRSKTDSIAEFVPTWSIETWLARLCGHPVAENSKLKYDSTLRSLWDEGAAEAATVRRSIEAWGQQDDNPPPSLADAYQEAIRVGLIRY